MSRIREFPSSFLLRMGPQFGKPSQRRLHEGRGACTFMKQFFGLSLIAPVWISLACHSAVSAADGDEAASPARAVRSTPKAEVPNFALLDHHGKYHELHRTQARAVVLFNSWYLPW